MSGTPDPGELKATVGDSVPPDPTSTVLIVDADPTIRRTVAEALEDEARLLLQAADAEEALGVMHQVGVVDVALIELECSGHNGLDLAQELMTVDPMVEVLITTTSPSLDSAMEAVRAGASDYLPKPFSDIDQLVQRVKRAEQRTRMRRQRAELEDELEQAQKLETLGKLVGGIAHDFNNLLSVITNSSVLVLEDLQDLDSIERETREDLEQLLEAARSAAAITSQLLAFSRKKRGPEPRPLDVNARIEALEPIVRPILKSADLDVDLAEDLVACVMDESQLEQVLMNLILNARDAMPDGGQIRIATRNVDEAPQSIRPAQSSPVSVHQGWVQIEVSDTGHGIPKELLRRVFEPFFTTKKEGRGTGLGLATVKRIVKEAHGRVEVSSTEGRGTTFRVYLPATTQSAANPAADQTSMEQGNGEKILVLDDEDAVRRTTCRLLRRAGFEVAEARSVEQCVQLVESGRFHPQLLLADIILPEQSGVAAAEIFEERWPDVAVLMMTGYDRETIKVHGAPVDVLLKPFRRERLVRYVKSMLEAAPDNVIQFRAR